MEREWKIIAKVNAQIQENHCKFFLWAAVFCVGFGKQV